MLKKMMLLASAVAALAAFAVPASASAATHYTYNNAAIPAGGVTAEYTGTAQFTVFTSEITGVGVHCTTVHAGIVIETNAAHVESFMGTECVGIDEFAPCAVVTEGVAETSVGTGFNWPIVGETNEAEEVTSLSIENVVAENEFSTVGCPPGARVEGTAEVHLTTAGSLTSIALTGHSLHTPAPNPQPAFISGTLTTSTTGITVE